jgi:hypothetical protein
MTIFTADIRVRNKRLFGIVVILQDNERQSPWWLQITKLKHTLWARKRRTGRECSM